MNHSIEPIALTQLISRTTEFKEGAEWEPLFPGIDVHWIYQTAPDGPAAALLRYQPGARAPLHEHLGYEHVLVLEGAQSDQHGTALTGTLTVNRPGSSHSVISECGCVVLIIWERRVRFLEIVDA